MLKEAKAKSWEEFGEKNREQYKCNEKMLYHTKSSNNRKGNHKSDMSRIKRAKL